ncbi:MAG: helix-turn-helix domain-containing protein [Bacteroidetes bacterium]|nr:helix-turn-helix domain-containing protein [Bacteroidota bacterium]
MEVQIIQDTESFKNSLLGAVKSELEVLKKEFQPKEPTKYLTRAEVAKMLQIDLSTLHSWVKKGKLKSYGIGHRVYFKRSEIETALQPLNK